MKDFEIFKSRRERFLSKLGGKAAIIPAASLVTHHSDCEYPFRQNSDFWYLTGFDEPDAVAIFLPFRPRGEQYVLFVQPSDSAMEVWTGFRWGEKRVVEQFGVDIAHSLDQLPQLLAHYLAGADGIAFRIGKDSSLDTLVFKTWSLQLDKAQRGESCPLSLVPPCSILHNMRLYKDDYEVQRIREATRISAEAHELVRDIARPGMNERQLQGVIEEYFLQQGARGPAYGSIVAGGDNACVLHYTSNRSILRDGELVLIDAGCSLYDYYNGDITRTFPINGKFSGEQKALYEIVLASQLKAIAAVIPGQDAEAVHFAALQVLVEGLVELGLLVGNVESIINEGAYRHIYMHKTGHWLGLDVHDVGAYRLGEYPVELTPGMVLTVEPGLYISDRLEVPKGQPEIHPRWKGIGIRIEDDILVTEKNPEILSKDALKSVDSMQNS
ncbi:aminopeptidase P N-terminal domain-containing protein [Prochlorococcus sp. MIT 1223]|uniref:aminopeptidase P N-terminal domain-containing protein n=1 Tax=Prochlorococcus sp. MIT 1223 TaxID=3096217 RepID=UPI002A761307|nr:aminopeptidase P N-terminal domain-containing protein [Prochlorococcus sp. MIT 1223]